MKQIRIAVSVILFSALLIALNRAGVIFPNQLDLSVVKLSLYGLTIGIAVILVAWLVEQDKEFTSLEIVLDKLLIWVIGSGIVGARLFHVVSDYNYYLSDPLSVFRVFDGGLSLFGALFGGTAAILYLFRNDLGRAKQLLNIAILYLPLAQMIGRFGNFFNQELFGPPTNLPWGIFIEATKRPAGQVESLFFAPLFFYEQLFLFLVTIVLWYLFKIKRSSGFTGGAFHAEWLPVAIYCFLYALVRLLIEQLRNDPVWLVGLSFGEVISIILLIVSTIYLVFYGKSLILRHK